MGARPAGDAGGGPVRIAIVGDFDRGKPSHWATEAALYHAAARLGVSVAPRWIATPELAGPGAARQRLAGCDGIWVAPGSPFASMAGALGAIELARRDGVPYLGTCAGFQYALIELSRNVLGLPDADSAENDPGGPNVVITPVACPMPDRPAGAPRMAGADRVLLMPGTRIAGLCGGHDLTGEYFCNLETNPAFVARWEASAGLRVAARGAGGEMRAFELDGHGFFVATLFQPQLSSRAERPHPIVEGYLGACLAARVRGQ
jgi:CTP synthase (UTP-ammonia lyase)